MPLPSPAPHSQLCVVYHFFVFLLTGTIYLATFSFCIYLVRVSFFTRSNKLYRGCELIKVEIQFNIYFFFLHTGKLVEEEEGNFALWLSYILTGAGANLVSWLVLPRNAVSVGASGAVFGLFAISVLVKVIEIVYLLVPVSKGLHVS